MSRRHGMGSGYYGRGDASGWARPSAVGAPVSARHRGPGPGARQSVGRTGLTGQGGAHPNSRNRPRLIASAMIGRNVGQRRSRRPDRPVRASPLISKCLRRQPIREPPANPEHIGSNHDTSPRALPRAARGCSEDIRLHVRRRTCETPLLPAYRHVAGGRSTRRPSLPLVLKSGEGATPGARATGPLPRAPRPLETPGRR